MKAWFSNIKISRFPKKAKAILMPKHDLSIRKNGSSAAKSFNPSPSFPSPNAFIMASAGEPPLNFQHPFL
jgi:hypothetical protein